MKPPIWYLIALSLSVLAPSPHAFDIVVTDSRLPVPVTMHAAVYDGDDSIYVVGGYDYDERHYDHVIKYSLNSGVVQVVGVYAAVSGVAAVMDGTDIFIFGGYGRSGGYSSAIYRFDTVSRVGVRFETLPVALNHMAAAWDPDNRMAYLFGGYRYDSTGVWSNIVLQYNPLINRVDEVAGMPGGRNGAAAVWAGAPGPDQLVYVFGGLTSTGVTDDILAYDPKSRNVTRLSVQLPMRLSYPRAVRRQGYDEVYVFASEGAAVFHTGTWSVSQIPTELALDFAAYVYVEKYDRIYVLGGRGRYFTGDEHRYRDEISYIQLNSSAIAN